MKELVIIGVNKEVFVKSTHNSYMAKYYSSQHLTNNFKSKKIKLLTRIKENNDMIRVSSTRLLGSY